MKITKRGTPPANLIWTGKCTSCKSEAEAKQSELTNIKHDQRDGSFSWEECPVCHEGNSGNGYGGMLFHPTNQR